MKCVFLEEVRVWSCCVAPVNRMVEVDSSIESEQKCSSPDWVTCPIAIPHLNGNEAKSKCPFLTESLRQYCKAASFTKLIPYNDDFMCRCNVDAHRYCPTYLERMRPKLERPDAEAEIQVPEHLAYSPNHMWLDIGAEGCCHVGVDAFMARFFGEIDGVTVFPRDGVQQVTVVLSVGDMHFPITFPRRMNVTGFNSLLKTNARALVDDPYGLGWICEDLEPRVGRRPPRKNQFHGLIHGHEAKLWMQKEVDSMSEFIQRMQMKSVGKTRALLNDGGLFSRGLANHLEREELVMLYNRFFAPPSILSGPALIK